jgi:hypothetical protein
MSTPCPRTASHGRRRALSLSYRHHRRDDARCAIQRTRQPPRRTPCLRHHAMRPAALLARRRRRHRARLDAPHAAGAAPRARAHSRRRRRQERLRRGVAHPPLARRRACGGGREGARACASTPSCSLVHTLSFTPVHTHISPLMHSSSGSRRTPSPSTAAATSPTLMARTLGSGRSTVRDTPARWRQTSRPTAARRTPHCRAAASHPHLLLPPLIVSVDSTRRDL